jgi:hypothetical protein
MGPRWGSIPRFTDWLIVSRNVTLTLTLTLTLRRPETREDQRGKSRIWDSKMWSRIPRDLDPKMTALARSSSNCKRQTRPLVRGSAPHQGTRNSQTVINIWSSAPDGCFIPRWTDRRSYYKTQKTKAEVRSKEDRAELRPEKNNLSNKQLHLIQNPLISCRVTRIHDDIINSQFSCTWENVSLEYLNITIGRTEFPFVGQLPALGCFCS